jgi:hypothetical protein
LKQMFSMVFQIYYPHIPDQVVEQLLAKLHFAAAVSNVGVSGSNGIHVVFPVGLHTLPS